MPKVKRQNKKPLYRGQDGKSGKGKKNLLIERIPQMKDEIKTTETAETIYEKGFKAYEPGMICRGKQYEDGKTYEEAGGSLCGAGMMHYCVNPFDVLRYYPLVNSNGKISDFSTVEALEKPVSDDTKSATKKLRIGAKLGLDGFVKACVDFLFEKTIKDMPADNVDSGDAAKIGSSGDAAQIGSSGYAAKIGSSGDAAQIGSSGRYAKIGSSGYAAKIGSSGRYAQIGSSGDAAKIGSSGYAAQIGSSGRYAKIGSSGDDALVICEKDHAVVACAGKRGKVKGPVGTWITLAEYGDWDGEGYPCLCVKSAQIDGEALKADTLYTLVNGEFVEV